MHIYVATGKCSNRSEPDHMHMTIQHIKLTCDHAPVIDIILERCMSTH